LLTQDEAHRARAFECFASMTAPSHAGTALSRGMRNSLRLRSTESQRRCQQQAGARLPHGDEVQIGDSLFVFLITEDDMTPDTSSVQLDDRLLTFTSVRLHLRNEGSAPNRFGLRTARDLSALLKISTEINSFRVERCNSVCCMIFEASLEGSISWLKRGPARIYFNYGMCRRLRPGADSGELCIILFFGTQQSEQSCSGK
jgi:hypothetical protein